MEIAFQLTADLVVYIVSPIDVDANLPSKILEKTGKNAPTHKRNCTTINISCKVNIPACCIEIFKYDY